MTEDGKRRRRRRPALATKDISQNGDGESTVMGLSDEERDIMRKKSHECPVPKPRGRLGEVLGFKKEGTEKLPRPRIETGTIRSRKDIS